MAERHGNAAGGEESPWNHCPWLWRLRRWRSAGYFRRRWSRE